MKRKLINSFLILTTSTMITKVFSLMNRMMLSRMLGVETMALYILIIPTLSLSITLAQFSIPSAVFRLVSHPKYENKKVIISALCISFVTCLFIIIGLLVFSKPISMILLKENDAYYPMLCIIPFIPLVGISGIMKNYFLGKEKLMTLSIAQFLEEVARIVFSYILISHFIDSSQSFLICIAILAMSIGELVSILFLTCHIHTKETLSTKNNLIIKDLMNIAFPLTGSRILHSIYNFIEPILLVYMLTQIGISKETVHLEYAIMSGYVVSLLFTPTFFNNVILRLIIPIFNRDIAYNHYKQLQQHILISITICFFISLPFTLLFYFYGKECLMFLYNTNQGYEYLKYMAIPFTLCYLQTPMSATLQCLNKNKDLFYLSVFEILVEFIFMLLLVRYFKVLTVGIVLLIGLLTTLLLSAYKIYKYVFKQ